MPFLNDQKVLVAGQVARSRDDTRRYLMRGLAGPAERGILDSVFLPTARGSRSPAPGTCRAAAVRC